MVAPVSPASAERSKAVTQTVMARPRSPKTALANRLGRSERPIYLLDEQGTIVYCNPALAEWTRVAAEKLIGRRVEYHSEHAPDTLPGVAAGLCPPPDVFRGHAVDGHVSCQANDGRLLFRLGRFEPLPTSPEADPSMAGVLALLSPQDLSAEALTANLAPDASSDTLHVAIRHFRRTQSEHFEPASLVGQSVPMLTVRRQIQMAAASDTPVTILGPAGSETEDLAKAIHYHPPFDTSRQLIPLESRTLGLEELRWAVEAVRGERRTEQANTLLFAQVDQLPLALQHEIRAIVAARMHGFRVIATAASDLRQLATGNHTEPFDLDLATLLATTTIEPPPLEQRREDLPLLSQWLVEECNRSSEKQVGGLRHGAVELLATYAWPGGLSELRDVISAAHANTTETQISVTDLPPVIHHAANKASLSDDSIEPVDLDELLARIERQMIERALQIADGNKTQAAELLGWNRPRFYRRLEQLK